MDRITPQQRKALELYFRLLADKLNESGLDQRKVLKPSIQIPWNHDSIKDQLWREIQKAMTNKESTTELDSKEIDRIYDVLNRHLVEKFGEDAYVPFPSEEGLYYSQKEK